MKELTREKLNKILEEHKHWINEDCKNWEKMRANLSGANLSDVDLSEADLRCANLRGANLSGANLHNADLSGANLHNADLSGANLHNADLSEAYLSDANLSGAYLFNADLSGAYLSGANLSDVNLSEADLYGADLRDADLRDADLCGANLHRADLSSADLSSADLNEANLRNADLSGAKNVLYIPMVCPEEGSFIGWKKVKTTRGYDVIVKLYIPSDAKRSSATTRKCRCSKAEVIAIYNIDGTEAEETTCHSAYDKNFIYEVGKIVEVTDFDDDRWNDCAKGIHFFISRQEAINY